MTISVDPVEALLQRETHAEHARAKRRGARIRAIAGQVAWELHAKGRLRCSRNDLEQELVVALAEHLYGGSAVDI